MLLTKLLLLRSTSVHPHVFLPYTLAPSLHLLLPTCRPEFLCTDKDLKVIHQGAGPHKLPVMGPHATPTTQFSRLPDLSVRPASAARSHAARWGRCILRGSGVRSGGSRQRPLLTTKRVAPSPLLNQKGRFLMPLPCGERPNTPLVLTTRTLTFFSGKHGVLRNQKTQV